MSQQSKTQHDSDYFRRIGRLGGLKKGPKGFGSTVVGSDGLTGPERAVKAAKISAKVREWQKHAKQVEKEND